MRATLGFQMPIDRSRRPIPRLTVWMRPEGKDETGWMNLKLVEAAGSETEVAKVLRQLFKKFFEKFPEQKYGSTMHVQTEITGVPFDSDYRRELFKQFAKSKQKKRACQRDLCLRFRRFKVNVVCVLYQQ